MVSEYATTARRPSVFTSRRKVVISNAAPRTTTVTVPWSIPVGMALNPAACAICITFSGRALVDISTSLSGRPSSALRTQPPTKYISCPAASTAAQTSRAAGSINQLVSAGIIMSCGRTMPAAYAPLHPRCNRVRRAPQNNVVWSPASAVTESGNFPGSAHATAALRKLLQPRPALA